MARINKISTLAPNTPTFKAKKSQQNAPQPQVIIVRQTGGVAPAVISAVCPGLGQLFDGRPGAAAGAFFGVTGTALASLILTGTAKNAALRNAAFLGGILLTIAAYIANIVNAAKGKQTQINFNQQ